LPRRASPARAGAIPAQELRGGPDPLPSWREGRLKQTLLRFVQQGLLERLARLGARYGAVSSRCGAPLRARRWPAQAAAAGTMQRKPRWQVEVSIPWAMRAAGR